MPSIAKPTRILLLTQWFDPEPTIKGLVFARELLKQGFEVEVVTGFPNYPGGKLYPGYKMKWLQREIINGVQITRVPLFPNHDHSAIKRALNYVSFAVASLFYILFIAKKAHVLYAYHPPLTVGIIACIVRLFRRIPVVYDIQDIWPDSLRATGMLTNFLALRFLGMVCNWVYYRVDHIVVLSPGFKLLLIARGVPEAKLSVVYNWANESSLEAPMVELPIVFPSSAYFRILFAGNMGKAQGLDTLLEAAELLMSQGSRVRWILLGGGVEVLHLKAEVARRKLSNLLFLPSVPIDNVANYFCSVEALVIHLLKDPLYEITIPSKTQTYMFFGKPLLMAMGGDAANLVKQSRCGLVVESQNPKALAQAAEQLAKTNPDVLAAMGQQAKAFYQQNLGITIGAQSFGEIFKQLAGTVK